MALPAVLLAASGIASLAQTISGLSRRSRAKRLLEDFERQELKNVADQLKVSTLGAELQSQEAQRRFATSVDALRSAGVRGVVGGLPAVEAQQQRLQRQIAADLDRQQKQIDLIRAQDEARIRQIQEQRESMEIAGLGSEMAAGSREFQTGLGGLSSTALAALSLEENKPQPPPPSPIQSGGFSGSFINSLSAEPFIPNYSIYLDGSFGKQSVPTSKLTDLSQGGFGRFLQQQ